MSCTAYLGTLTQKASCMIERLKHPTRQVDHCHKEPILHELFHPTIEQLVLINVGRGQGSKSKPIKQVRDFLVGF